MLHILDKNQKQRTSLSV